MTITLKSTEVEEEFAVPWLGCRNDEDDPYRELIEDTKKRLEQARSWLEDCVANHGPPCQLDTVQEQPRRVLDISSDAVRLQSASSVPGKDWHYACLSYSWGKSGNIMTKRENIDTFRQGIDTGCLPKTIDDAIRIARSLGMRYLWIDALCIIQDDRSDFMNQIPMMSSIYRGADVVISAQGAASVHEGCLAIQSAKNAPFRRVELPFRDPDDGGRTRLVKLSVQEKEQEYYSGVPGHHSSRPSSDDEALIPLSTRAWVFQESFLARRILFVTPSELSWQCGALSRCECRTEPKKAIARFAAAGGDFFDTKMLSQVLALKNLKHGPWGPLLTIHLWGELIRQYSMKNLSVWTDRLAAIQGVSTALMETIPEDFQPNAYLFGMWRPLLEQSLPWHRNVLGPTADSDVAKTLKEMAPSWSWVTVPGAVEYYPVAWNTESETFVTIVNVECSYDAPKTGIFGAGKGTILLCGRLIPVTIDDPKPQRNGTVQISFPDDYNNAGNQDSAPAILRMELDDPTDEEIWRCVTHFLPLVAESGRMHGICLAPQAADVRSDGMWEDASGPFRRIGYAYDHDRSVDFWAQPVEAMQKQTGFFTLV